MERLVIFYVIVFIALCKTQIAFPQNAPNPHLREQMRHRMADFKPDEVRRPSLSGKPLADPERLHREGGSGHDRHCQFMDEMHMEERVGANTAAVMCNMYRQWGSSMTSGQSSWRPTTNQKRWFDSLGAKHNGGGHRSKRQAPTNQRAVRKEYRSLTDHEREKLHQALNAMKSTMVDGMSMYDVIVMNHAAYRAPAAHFGPAFLPFHREYLFR